MDPTGMPRRKSRTRRNRSRSNDRRGSRRRNVDRRRRHRRSRSASRGRDRRRKRSSRRSRDTRSSSRRRSKPDKHERTNRQSEDKQAEELQIAATKETASTVSTGGNQGLLSEEEQMRMLMGFEGFGTTKGKQVADNATGASKGAVAVSKKREYRQYMHRKGGFNRPLSPISSSK